MPKVITSGETMALLTPTSPGRLRHTARLELRIGGAESNVAIALARLGVETAWISRVGDDELGRLVVERIRGEGVDVSHVVFDPGAPTGLYLREQAPLGARAHYYRSGSAASKMAPLDLEPQALHSADIVHVTGITAALSASCAEYLLWLAEEGKRQEALISLDVNYRSRLWTGAQARAYLHRLIPLADLVFLSDEEAGVVWPDTAGGELLETLAEQGPREVILKHGARGCTALIHGQRLHAAGFAVKAVETTGAGDAFAAGYLAAKLWGHAPADRLRAANALGAFNVLGYGDYESLPSRAELDAFLQNRPDMGR